MDSGSPHELLSGFEPVELKSSDGSDGLGLKMSLIWVKDTRLGISRENEETTSWVEGGFFDGLEIEVAGFEEVLNRSFKVKRGDIGESALGCDGFFYPLRQLFGFTVTDSAIRFGERAWMIKIKGLTIGNEIGNAEAQESEADDQNIPTSGEILLELFEHEAKHQEWQEKKQVEKTEIELISDHEKTEECQESKSKEEPEEELSSWIEWGAPFLDAAPDATQDDGE